MTSQTPVIRVAGLRKVFHIYDRPRDLLREVLGGRSKARLFTALDDISFNVARGEAVGILGRNGAGKSTLLRIISRTLDATEGEVVVQGRLSSILELGTGFNGALTGRENVIVGGLMIGLSREEVLDKLEWILDFSELREFINQPFRTYSSGMQARLTFATAVCVRPELLVVDEALAVGDARFQRKCFSHMHSLRAAGCTILLVSHDPNTVAAFCDRALLLERGRLVVDGPPQKVGATYHQMMFGDGGMSLAGAAPARAASLAARGESRAAPEADLFRQLGVAEPRNIPDIASVQRLDLTKNLSLQTQPDFHHGLAPPDAHETGGSESAGLRAEPAAAGANPATEASTPVEDHGWSRQLRAGTLQEATVTALQILDEEGNPTTRLDTGRHYRFRVEAVFSELVLRPTAGFDVQNSLGQTLFGIDTRSARFELPPRGPGQTLTVELDVTMWLTNGPFFLGAGVGSSPDGVDAYAIDYCHSAIQFDVPRLEGIHYASLVNLQPRFRSPHGAPEAITENAFPEGELRR